MDKLLLNKLKEISSNLSILYVEDEPETRNNIEGTLKEFFGEVVTATNGADGLSAYYKGAFDIVLTDITMPEVNGITMSRTIKQDKPEQKIIIITAYQDINYILEAIELNIDGYILKPINNSQFFGTLFKTCNFVKEHKELKLHQEHLEELVLTKTNELRQLNTQLVEINKHLEAAIVIKDYLLEILHTMDLINRLLISDKSSHEIMSESCAILAKHGMYHLAWIGEVGNDKIDIVAHSNDSTGYISKLNLSLEPQDLTSQGPSVQSILQNKTIITQSVNMDHFALWQADAKESGLSSSICLPLRGSSAEKPFGTMAIYSSKPFGFLAEEITMLEDLAGDIGYSIDFRNKKEELRKAMTTDSLTGLPNRAMLLKSLHDIQNPKLLFLNIDRFRDINTVYGFDAGDFVLRSFAAILFQFLWRHKACSLFKLYGDIFVILLPEFYTTEAAESIVAEISNYLEEKPFDFQGIEIWLSITAGFNDTRENIIENVEIALKEAKKLKLPFRAFNVQMRSNKEHEENIYWYKIIKEAIKTGTVLPYFQGISDNATGKIVKYESLLRIILPDGTVQSPIKFLDIAKKTGLYPELTKIAVSKTIETFKDLPFDVSINLSSGDMTNSKMIAYIHKAVEQSGIGHRIVFEILESEGIGNYEEVGEFIETFKELGCKFAIDDFGTGFSNFEHLIRLRIDFLKIDGSLIKNIQHDKNTQAIVKNINNFAIEMGMTTIAEFVSSAEIYELVKSFGISYSQGYYFSQPQPNVV